jgi:hypothetical protein
MFNEEFRRLASTPPLNLGSKKAPRGKGRTRGDARSCRMAAGVERDKSKVRPSPGHVGSTALLEVVRLVLKFGEAFQLRERAR